MKSILKSLRKIVISCAEYAICIFIITAPMMLIFGAIDFIFPASNCGIFVYVNMWATTISLFSAIGFAYLNNFIEKAIKKIGKGDNIWAN